MKYVKIFFVAIALMMGAGATAAIQNDYDPRAEFIGMVDELCYGTLLSITPIPIDADSIYWDFGDFTPLVGELATSKVKHLYAESGIYTITATLKHLVSETARDTTFTITVNPAYGVFEIGRNVLFSDDFESYEGGTLASTLTGWTLTNGRNANQKIINTDGNNYLQLTADIEGSRIYTDFSVAESELLTFEIKMYSTSNPSYDCWGLRIENSSNQQQCAVGFKSGKFTAHVGSTRTNYPTVNDFPAQNWYNVKIVCDLAELIYSVYINDVLQEFSNGATSFAMAGIPSRFTLVSTYQTTYFDDVKISIGENFTASNLLPEVDLALCADELPFIFGTQELVSTGQYTEIFQTVHGCDSTVTMNFTVLELTYATDIQEHCDSYTAPDGQVYTESNPNITAVIPNAAGCDSIITINLTIDKVDTSVEINGNTLTANAFPAEYQWVDCDNGYSELPGETKETFSPSTSSNYAVRITQNGCVDVSNCHHVDGTSIIEVATASHINIYPNPTTGKLTIDNGQLAIGEVNIFDINGSKLSTLNSQLSTLDVDFTNYANGTYFIEVNNTTHKIIKN